MKEKYINKLSVQSILYFSRGKFWRNIVIKFTVSSCREITLTIYASINNSFTLYLRGNTSHES